MIDSDHNQNSSDDPSEAQEAMRQRLAVLERDLAGCSVQMPRYQCHKKVWALKIASVRRDSEEAQIHNRETDGSAIITPAEEGYAPFRVDNAFVMKHKPEAGGYYVVYDDGYKSFSPAKAFEDGYTRL